jgi:hypothetical protein
MVSFFVPLRALDFWLTPPDPNASVIHVVEATYGQNCQDFTPPPGNANLVKAGNATAALAKACDTFRVDCTFNIDYTKIGDPAAGCAKNFIASWRCGSDQQVHRITVPAEASGHSVALVCIAL